MRLDDRTPRVEIYRRGRWWFGHRSVGVMDVGEGPLVAWTQKRIERKALRFVESELRRQREKAQSYTIEPDALTREDQP